MSPAQQRGLALWGALLSTVVCLGFLSVTRLVSVLVLLTVLGLIIACWYVASRRARHDVTLQLDVGDRTVNGMGHAASAYCLWLYCLGSCAQHAGTGVYGLPVID